jgi:hypothetical protein
MDTPGKEIKRQTELKIYAKFILKLNKSYLPIYPLHSRWGIRSPQDIEIN